jgi:hypothetical protein
MAILDLISQVHLPSSVNKLPRYLKHFTFSYQPGINKLTCSGFGNTYYFMANDEGYVILLGRHPVS